MLYTHIHTDTAGPTSLAHSCCIHVDTTLCAPWTMLYLCSACACVCVVYVCAYVPQVAAEDDYQAGAQACDLVRRYGEKPPAWASKLCVTCSS